MPRPAYMLQVIAEHVVVPRQWLHVLPFPTGEPRQVQPVFERLGSLATEPGEVGVQGIQQAAVRQTAEPGSIALPKGHVVPAFDRRELQENPRQRFDRAWRLKRPRVGQVGRGSPADRPAGWPAARDAPATGPGRYRSTRGTAGNGTSAGRRQSSRSTDCVVARRIFVYLIAFSATTSKAAAEWTHRL